MTTESDVPREPEAPGAAEAPPFMKRFEESIVAYAQAAEAGNMRDAERAAFEALIMAAEEAQRNPTPSLLAKQEASECESRADWAGAEAHYRRVIALEELGGEFGMIAKAQMDLSRLLRLMGRLAEAWNMATAATASARRVAIFPVLFMTLENQVFCAEARGDFEAALAAASEAAEIIEPGKIYDSMRARALINRARALVATSDIGRAHLDLAESEKLLAGPTLSKMLPGPMLALANWWDLKSRVAESQADFAAALEAITKCIEKRRQMEGPYARLALALSLDRLGALSNKAGDPERAARSIAEAEELRKELRLTPDPANNSG